MENLCKNFIQWAVVTIGLVVVGLGAPEVATGQMVPLPQDLEVQLALSALPAHLRDDATIYVLDPKAGYTVFKEGSNGFVALVGRTSTRFYQADWDYAYPTDQLIPMAYDAVGMEFHLKPWFDLARMRAEGASPTDAKERLRAGFTDGNGRRDRPTSHAGRSPRARSGRILRPNKKESQWKTYVRTLYNGQS